MYIYKSNSENILMGFPISLEELYWVFSPASPEEDPLKSRRDSRIGTDLRRTDFDKTLNIFFVARTNDIKSSRTIGRSRTASEAAC